MKKNKEEVKINLCINCKFCTFDENSLSLAGIPILGTCEYQKFKFLVNFNTCKNFKTK